MLTRNCTLALLGLTLSSVGCWVSTEPPPARVVHVEHVEHEHHAPAEDGDGHHEEHHEHDHDHHD